MPPRRLWPRSASARLEAHSICRTCKIQRPPVAVLSTPPGGTATSEQANLPLLLSMLEGIKVASQRNERRLALGLQRFHYGPSLTGRRTPHHRSELDRVQLSKLRLLALPEAMHIGSNARADDADPVTLVDLRLSASVHTAPSASPGNASFKGLGRSRLRPKSWVSPNRAFAPALPSRRCCAALRAPAARHS